MGLHSYAAASSEHAQELVKALTKEDVLTLAEDLKMIGLHAWMGWMAEHKQEIDDYVNATPASRAKKKWLDPVLRRRLSLAAIVQCRAAHALLEILAKHEYMLAAGVSHRCTTAYAGNAYREIMDTEVQEWPEEFEWACLSPFLNAHGN